MFVKNTSRTSYKVKDVRAEASVIRYAFPHLFEQQLLEVLQTRDGREDAALPAFRL